MEKKIFISSGSTNGYPAFKEKSGEQVQVLRRLTPQETDEEVGEMFRIRFSDGQETGAFADELT